MSFCTFFASCPGFLRKEKQMNSDIVSLIIILICVMLSAYFSATETSFTSLNRIRMKNMAEKGDKRAELVLKLLENFDKLLSTILVGNNIVNIGLSSLATVLFIKLLGGDSGATVSTIGIFKNLAAMPELNANASIPFSSAATIFSRCSLVGFCSLL